MHELARHGQRRRAIAIALVLLLIAVRVLSLVSAYFFEEDEASLAVGTAALVANTPGFVYRYAVQAGYYRLIETITLLLGGAITSIPWVMKGASVVAGTLIPLAGYRAFRDELTPRDRGLVAIVLAINPIIWHSSQYGNSALLSAAAGTWALALLSNRPPARLRLAAYALLGSAILMRADAVLLVPAALLLAWRTTGSWRTAVLELGALGAVLAAIYGALLVGDPRMDGAAAAVTRHMSATPGPSMFWEYLLWAISPVPAVLAVWGARRLLESQPAVAAVLLVWALPTLGFYFRATTTPRYFVNVMLPVAVATAAGLVDAVRLLQPLMTRRAAWAGVGLAASLHVFVALGHVRPARLGDHLLGGTFRTDDGDMPTGALLARGLLNHGALFRALPHPAFGTTSIPYWEGVSFTKAVAVLADPARPARTVIVRLAGGYGHAFHYHAHAAGARYEYGPRNTTDLWGDALWLHLGTARVMAVSTQTALDALRELEVEPGDEVWLVVGGGPDPIDVTPKLPAGLALRPTTSFDDHFRTFAVVRQDATLVDAEDDER